MMRELVAVVALLAAYAPAQELRNCQTRACRSFKELLAAKDPLVMKSNRVCFYDGKAPFEGEGRDGDQFFLLSTKGQTAWRTWDNSVKAYVFPSLVSIEIIDGQPNEPTYYAWDKYWTPGRCWYAGDRTKSWSGLQPYVESGDNILFAELVMDSKNGVMNCSATTIRKSTWRFTYHEELVAGEFHYADYPGRCFPIPKQSAR